MMRLRRGDLDFPVITHMRPSRSRVKQGYCELLRPAAASASRHGTKGRKMLQCRAKGHQGEGTPHKRPRDTSPRSRHMTKGHNTSRGPKVTKRPRSSIKLAVSSTNLGSKLIFAILIICTLQKVKIPNKMSQKQGQGTRQKTKIKSIGRNVTKGRGTGQKSYKTSRYRTQGLKRVQKVKVRDKW